MHALRRWKLIALKAVRQFGWADLRWSYITIVGMVVGGALINLILPFGWTVWPLIPVFAMLTVLNEIAERNGQGVPPFQVYAFVVLVLAIWVVGVIIMSKVNVFIQLLGVGALVGYTYHGYMKYRERLKLIMKRRDEGRCIHCGEPDDGSMTYCENCGMEPDPERASQQRTSSIVQYGKKSDHARKVLTPESLGNIAARKEKALLANSQRRRGRPPKR
jgi:hypothetical protein